MGLLGALWRTYKGVGERVGGGEGGGGGIIYRVEFISTIKAPFPDFYYTVFPRYKGDIIK